VVAGLTAGQSTIRAQLGSTIGSTLLTVNNATLQSITVNPGSVTIALGTNGVVTALGTFRDDAPPNTVRVQDVTQTVLWDTVDHAVATISNAAGSRGLVHSEGVGGPIDVTATQAGMTGFGSVTVSNATLQNITLSPSAPSIANGTTVQFQATGVYSDSSTQDLTNTVTWGTPNVTIASISNGGGTNGLAKGLAAGTAQITATFNGITVRESLTVTVATLVSINVTPGNPTIAKGSRQQFVATGVYTDNSQQDLTATVAWDSGDTNVATVGSGGVGTAGEATGVEAGTTTITATVGGVTIPIVGTATIHVSPALLQTIVVSPANPIIARGTAVQFTATGNYSDGSTQDLTAQATWGSTSPGVASVSNSVGSRGLASSHNAGTTTITATVGAFSDSTTLAVSAATLQSISVGPATPTIAKGTTLQFRAFGTYTDSTVQDITNSVVWSTSDGTVATVGNGASSHGFSTAINAGQTTITATQGARFGSQNLTVTAATLRSIAISPSDLTLARGTTQQFTATGTYTDGSTQIITTQVTWASDDTAVATISSGGGTNGLATAVGVGSASISATLGAVVSRAIVLTVSPATLVTIDVTPPGVSIASGTTQQFTATGNYTDATHQDLTSVVSWTSNAPSVAVVSNAAGTKGLATAGNVQATGLTTITATLGGVSGHTDLTVNPATLDSIHIDPPTVSIANGTTRAFTATAHYSDGSEVDVTTSITWSSDNTTVATINAAGVATSHAQGLAHISGTLSGVTSDSAALTVTAEILQSISITPLNRVIITGDIVAYIAIGTYTDLSTQDITTLVTWSTDNTGIALISNADGGEGLATGVGTGTAHVSATLGSVSSSTSLNVNSP
jgi:hypothetical protein